MLPLPELVLYESLLLLPEKTCRVQTCVTTYTLEIACCLLLWQAHCSYLLAKEHAPPSGVNSYSDFY